MLHQTKQQLFDRIPATSEPIFGVQSNSSQQLSEQTERRKNGPEEKIFFLSEKVQLIHLSLKVELIFQVIVINLKQVII